MIPFVVGESLVEEVTERAVGAFADVVAEAESSVTLGKMSIANVPLVRKELVGVDGFELRN
jgi:hypothetical protein